MRKLLNGTIIIFWVFIYFFIKKECQKHSTYVNDLSLTSLNLNLNLNLF